MNAKHVLKAQQNNNCLNAENRTSWIPIVMSELERWNTHLSTYVEVSLFGCGSGALL